MNKVILSLAAATVLLSGCIAVPYDAGIGYHRSYGREYYGGPARVYRDRDGDGVPNRYDRAPANPYRY
jgi:uncharacterized protein YceK